MHAALLHDIGGPLTYGELDDPVGDGDEVVVDLAFASVNPLDVWVSQGSIGAAAANLPWTPGTEATGFLDGAPVLVRGAGIGVLRRGLYASKALVPAAAVQPLAGSDKLAEIAALGVAGLTAWNAVHPKAAVTAHDRVLILGASGGVGCVAVQIAKSTGATVWGQTSSGAKVEAILAAGADHAVVTEAEGLVAATADFRPTVVLDALGGPYTGAAIEALQPSGRLVSYGTSAGEVASLNMRSLYRKGIVLSGYAGLLESAAEQARVLTGLLDDIASGRINVPYTLVPLSEANSCFRRILGRDVAGKLILDCRS